MQQGALLKLTGVPWYVERMSMHLQRRINLWLSTAAPVRGRRIPAAAAERLERMKFLAS
jgi:hypothetical protein